MAETNRRPRLRSLEDLAFAVALHGPIPNREIDCAKIRLRFTELGATLPLSPDPEHFGVLMDAAGRDVATVDVNGERDDAEVSNLIEAIAFVVNVAAGFPPEQFARPDARQERVS